MKMDILEDLCVNIPLSLMRIITLSSLLGKGTWIDSYEAVEHVKRLGISDTPVCHTLIGYSSGFMSTICGQTVLAKEITCVGKGDSECSWITRTQKEWESEMQEESTFLS